jgi:hypothetical protein
MRDIYKEIFWYSLKWGGAGGVLLVLSLSFQREFYLPGLATVIGNFILLILLMIISAYAYRKKTGIISFKITRELAFLVYIIAFFILMIFRILEGVFNTSPYMAKLIKKTSIPAMIIAPLIIFMLGRILSYVIGILVNNLKKSDNLS